MEKLSLAEFAKKMGLHKSQITRAIHDGRITPEFDEKNKKFLYYEKALEQWNANTDLVNSASAKMTQTRKNEKQAQGVAPTYTESRAKREAVNAKKAEIELEEKMGKLIKVEVVQAEAFKFFRNVRDMLLNIPDRVAPEFAVEQNQFKIHGRLSQEIRRTLEEVSEKYNVCESENI